MPYRLYGSDILGFIDHNITVNIIKNSAIVDKKALHLPHEIRNVIHCKNPRCITSIEQGLDHIFVLTDPEKEVYRCKYCEEKYDRRRKQILWDKKENLSADKFSFLYKQDDKPGYVIG